MKKLIIGIVAAVMLCGCASVTADFKWTPTNPKAGESVYFMNLSNDGEDWEWSFGDGTTPSTKTNPTKVFKKPGEYTVTLRVDGKNSWTASHQVTVTDTFPYIKLSDSTGLHYYQKNTISLVLYNPYSYSYTLQWELPKTAHISGNKYAIRETDSSYLAVDQTVTAYFSVHDEQVHVRCTVKMFKDDSTKIKQSYVLDTLIAVQDVPARSLLMETTDGKLYRQRIYDLGLEAPMQEKNYSALTPQNRVVDALNNKVYYIENNVLWCANADGSNPMSVDEEVLDGALCLDSKSNQVFWGTQDGVMFGHLATNAYNRVTDIAFFSEGKVAKALKLDENER